MIDTPLTSRVALVTGSSRGIGSAIAQRLAAHGAAVVLHGSGRSSAELQALCDKIIGAGGRAAAVACDLGDAAARSDLIARANACFGPIDILVNNAAAISAYAPPSKMDLPARQAMFEINLQAPIDLIQQALPFMKEKHWGRIVNISSGTVQQPSIPYVGPAKFVHALCLYGASKAALDRYSIGLAAELHGSGIHINATLPYKIAMTANADAVARAALRNNPDWVEPVEMMAEAVYLLIAGSITGAIEHSRALLQMMQQPLHALDGKTVVGDALTLVRI